MYLLITAAIGIATAVPAFAEVEPERCPRFVARDEARIIPASLEVAQLHDGEVRLTFLGHASFLIESPLGVNIEENFQLGEPSSVWTFRTPSLWRVGVEGERHFLQMSVPPSRPMTPGSAPN